MIIDRKMSILKIVQEFPGARKVFDQYKMKCVGCTGALAESIEKGAEMHGIDPDRLTEDLNKLVSSKEASL
ncbi:MAG: DUF1858 domain-containing protein [Nitrospinota bacterium]